MSDPARPGPYRGGVGSRREARERALTLLYEADAKELSVGEVLAGLPLDPETFTRELVEGVEAHRHELDAVIEDRARDGGWSLARMPRLDVLVLRLAIFELLHRPDIPRGVVINEAVELARRFSTDESNRFVNGVLTRVADDAGR